MDPQDALDHRSQVENFQRRHRTQLVTMLFSDIVGSTRLKQTLGDRGAIPAIQKHHATVREILSRFDEGEEIGTAGDSFFIVFAKPSDAVKFSLLLQAGLRRLAVETGHPVFDRIGIHVGEVWIDESAGPGKSKDLYGIQVDTCARVSSLGGADQILLSRFAFDSARQVLRGGDLESLAPLSWLNHGPYIMKGVEEALEVCEVGETGKAPLTRPANTDKARRFDSPDAEAVLGWRPAVDQPVPHTNWVLEKKLGEGGFGEVWHGRDKVLKTRHIFKFCFRADRVRSLKREVTLFRLLKERVGAHPNIASVEATYFDEPPFYIVMQYADGSDLPAWCEARGGIERIPLAARLEIIAQAADALQAAHDSGVIHRDVKPTNIIVGGDGTTPAEIRVKLTDFGIGQVVSEELLSGMTRIGFTHTMMASGSQSGTQMYMAPELFAGKPASPGSDIYALGVVLYQLLSRDLSRPLATDWGRDVHDGALREDLMKCFAGNPTERFTGAGQLAKSLRALDLQRPRNLDWKRASAMLYGIWGTGMAYVIGLAFALAGYGSFWLIAAMGMLTVLVSVNYMAICKYFPDGGGAYSAARPFGRFVAVCGGLFLFADLVVTAALCALSAFLYIGLPRPELFAAGAILVIGALNILGPKQSGSLAMILALPALGVVALLIGLAFPHLGEAMHNLQPMEGGFLHNWPAFVGTVLALSGIEAIANLTGVMKLDAGSTMDNPSVARESAKAILPVTIVVLVATTLLALAMLALHGLQIVPTRGGDAEVNAPGAEGVRDYMLRYMAQIFAGGAFGATVGHIAALAVSVSFGVLLLSTVNTAIAAMIGLSFVMARDGEMPRGFTKLNRFGVPLKPLWISAALPLLLVLLVAGMSGLADMYTLGVVGAIAVTTGACALNKSLPISLSHRLLFGLTTAILLCIMVTLATEKRASLLFFVCFILLGLALLGGRKSRWT